MADAYIIPSLQHTGCRSSMEPPKPTYLRPDGSVSIEMRNQIQRRVRKFPIASKRDVRDQDMRRSVQQALGERSQEVFALEASFRDSDDADAQNNVSLADSLSRPSQASSSASSSAAFFQSSRRREKKPYSTVSLVNAILENEYG